MSLYASLNITHRTQVSGGCINHSQHLTTVDGKAFFFKENPNPAPGFFQAEADGLSEIEALGWIRTPKVLEVSKHFLLLEWVETGQMTQEGWQQLGQGLARQHKQKKPCFGFHSNGFCGETPQLNPKNDNGFEFYRQARLGYQCQLAFDHGRISQALLKKIEALADKLEQLIPWQAPGLLHGDLWSGNVIADKHGLPVLIDPGAHWGWPEAEIAFTHMFGGFHRQFYLAYQEQNPFEPGFEERISLYNLYHYLNHLNLFGSSYLGQVQSITHQYL